LLKQNIQSAYGIRNTGQRRLLTNLVYFDFLCRSPFDSGKEYPLVRETVMKLSTEIISAAQNDNRIKESEEKLMDAVSIIL
jgi:hypothetical protein